MRFTQLLEKSKVSRLVSHRALLRRIDNMAAGHFYDRQRVKAGKPEYAIFIPGKPKIKIGTVISFMAPCGLLKGRVYSMLNQQIEVESFYKEYDGIKRLGRQTVDQRSVFTVSEPQYLSINHYVQLVLTTQTV